MRVPVELRRAYRLLNHGPVVLVTSAAHGRTNVMPAAWVMPVDFEPPLVAAVIAAGTDTRAMVDVSGELALSIPPASMLHPPSTATHVHDPALDQSALFPARPVIASDFEPPLV